MTGDGVVRDLLATACPERTVVAVDPIGRGNRKDTALVRFAEGSPLVVQRATDRRAIRTEARLLRAIGERTTVPVPAVPAVHAVGTHDGEAYLLAAHVGGADLHERFVDLSRPTRRALVERFGGWLAELHEAFAFEGYGALTVADGDADGTDVWRDEGDRTAGLVAERDNWASWFEEHATAAVERLPAAFDDLRGRLAACVADAPEGGSPPARLYPWDFRPGNALVADGDVQAVLDWEAPLAAPPALSVATAEYLVADWYVAESAPLRRAFRAGYERERPYPDPAPAHRVAAIADSAVDSRSVVTNPRYPELDREESVAVHRAALERALAAWE